MLNVSVIGSGTMGNGIAHVFALAGYPVALIDVNQQQLDKAITIIRQNLERQVDKNLITKDQQASALSSISTHTDMMTGVARAGLVIEAATENLDIKLEIFRKLDSLCPPDSILASNTSSISITQIAGATKRPEQVIGMHFMNPVPVMKLVEVIRGHKTSEQTSTLINGITKQIGKIPVEVNDYPGFIANRILMPMINEAICALHEGVGGVEEIDSIMQLGMAHPMGPLKLADFIGLDVCLSILKVLQDGFGNPKYAPCPLLVNMVRAGNLGVKTGEGFYDYSSGTTDSAVATNFKN